MIAPEASTTTRNRRCSEKNVRRCRPLIRIDPALGKARNVARAHALLEHGQRDAKPVGDDGCIDLDLAIFEFDRFHDAGAALRLIRAG